jgi:succinoglycan biosynthesis protein ExoA
MNRPRVLHLRASNFVGGPERQLLRYAELDGEGPWEVVFGVYIGAEEGREFRDAILSRGLQVIPLTVGSLLFSVRELVNVVRNQKFALICTHGYKADIVGLLAGHIAKVPVACFLRGWTRENRRVRLYEALDRSGLRFADRIVCLSGSQAERVARDSSLSAKIRVVTNAINASQIDPAINAAAREELCRRFRLPRNSFLVATGGRLSPEKGVGDLVDAAAQLRDKIENARFLIFGSGALQHELEQKVINLKLEGHVTFAGFEPDLRHLLPGVDVLVNPSHSEEMPNIVLEGMAEGIPVVATAVGGVEEIAGPHGAVRLVPMAQPLALAEAILELHTQPERARDLARAGRDRIVQSFSVGKQRDQIHALYKDVLGPSEVSPVDGAILSRSESAVADSRFIELCHGEPAPFLSIVLPIRNEEAHIGAVLKQLEEQEYPPDRFEVLVAVGTSTDRTTEVVEHFKEHSTMSIRRFDNPAKLSSAGRNIGARHAQGEYVIFIDGHCNIPSKTLLRDTATTFKKTGADCLCRPQPLKMFGNNLFQKVVAHARATPLGHGTDSTIYDMAHEGPVNPSSAGAIYRRTVFERVGDYDENFDACEDVEFNYRVFKAGLNSYISPRLAIEYQPRASLSALWRQMMRYGSGRYRLIEKHRDAFSFGQVVPAAVLLWLVFGGIASVFSRPFSMAFGLSLAFYATVVLYYSVGLGVRHGFRHLVLGPFVYLTIHLGLGAGFLSEAFRRGRNSRRSEAKTSSTSSGKPSSLKPPFSVQTSRE